MNVLNILGTIGPGDLGLVLPSQPPKGKRPPADGSLLRLRGEPTNESVAVPKLNVVGINESFGRFNGGGIVRVIVQKFGSNEIEIPVDTDDVGAIVRQCCCSLDQAGAQNSQSPIKAAGGSVMGVSKFALCSVVD